MVAVLAGQLAGARAWTSCARASLPVRLFFFLSGNMCVGFRVSFEENFPCELGVLYVCTRHDGALCSESAHACSVAPRTPMHGQRRITGLYTCAWYTNKPEDDVSFALASLIDRDADAQHLNSLPNHIDQRRLDLSVGSKAYLDANTNSNEEPAMVAESYVILML